MSLEKFAKAARRRLHESVRLSIEHVLQSDTAEIRAREKAVRQLREEIARSSKKQVIERVAYTWFNRFCALRYMDLQGFNKVRVITPSEGASQPEILQEAKQGYFDDTIVSNDIADRVRDLLSGRQSSDAPEQEAYRLLLVAVCNYYHGPMPFMFERIADYTELLLPNDLLSQSAILHELREAMDEEACDSIEVIGWLYQYYIAEKKDEVIGKKVKPEDIPAATQLFTPNWIVKYMVQNSLGAQWLATYPDSPLKGQMEYYIEPAEQTDEVNAKLAEITPESLNPEEITLIDPACGSGHILVEAYDVFNAIYLERGYTHRDVPQLILEKNLYGLDIDERAAQLTAFALMMKGRADDRRFFERGVRLNVMAIEETSGLNNAEFIERVIQASRSLVLKQTGFKENDLFPRSNKQLALKPSEESTSGDEAELRNALELVVDTFEHAKTFGSLIRVPEELASSLPALKRLSEETSHDLFVSEMLKRLRPLVQQAELLAAQYDAVVANPPYMGKKYFSQKLDVFVRKKYPESAADVFSSFMIKGMQMLKGTGTASMVTLHNWMFLKDLTSHRELFCKDNDIISLLHLGPRAFPTISGEVVQVAVYSAKRSLGFPWNTVCFRRVIGTSEQKRASQLAESEGRYEVQLMQAFQHIEGSPILYWFSKEARAVFSVGVPLKELAKPRAGLSTGDNSTFQRLWYEVEYDSIGLQYSSASETLNGKHRWFPCNSGGDSARWYGNHLFVVDWEDDGRRLKSFKDAKGKLRSRPQNTQFYFEEGVTWNKLGSSRFCGKYKEEGFIFDDTSRSAFPDDKDEIYAVLGILNSKIGHEVLTSLNPTMSFTNWDLGRMPILKDSRALNVVKQLVNITKNDWNLREQSWRYEGFPGIHDCSRRSIKIKELFRKYISGTQAIIEKTKHLEKQNNQIFIQKFGLKNELRPDVSIEEITLTVNPAYRYGGKLTEKQQWGRFGQDTMKELVSYGVGCMLGRYSLDKPGLLLANAGDTLDDYLAQIPAPSFMPDDDNVLPILGGEWFVDDIAERMKDFLKASFGEEHFEENLAYLEDGLGRDLKSYFLKDFYKDHVKTYKKRPIYWLFSSPNGTFNALIYMHRYRSDTVSVILNDYLRPFKVKLAAKSDSLEQLANNPSASQRDRTKALKEQDNLDKQIAELAEYEAEVLYPLATEQIEIDLNDGVKTNYPKFGEALKKVRGLS